MSGTNPYENDTPIKKKKKTRRPPEKGILEIAREKVMKFMKKTSIDTHNAILGREKKPPHKKKRNTDPWK